MALLLGLVAFILFKEIQILSDQIEPLEKEEDFFREARFFVGVVWFWSLVDLIFYAVNQDPFYLLNVLFSVVWMLIALFAASPKLGFLAKKSRKGLIAINQRRARKFLVFWGITLLIIKMWLIFSSPVGAISYRPLCYTHVVSQTDWYTCGPAVTG